MSHAHLAITYWLLKMTKLTRKLTFKSVNFLKHVTENSWEVRWSNIKASNPELWWRVGGWVEPHCECWGLGGHIWASSCGDVASQPVVVDKGPDSPWRRWPWRAVWSGGRGVPPARSSLQTGSGLQRTHTVGQTSLNRSYTAALTRHPALAPTLLGLHVKADAQVAAGVEQPVVGGGGDVEGQPALLSCRHRLHVQQHQLRFSERQQNESSERKTCFTFTLTIQIKTVNFTLISLEKLHTRSDVSMWQEIEAAISLFIIGTVLSDLTGSSSSLRFPARG